MSELPIYMEITREQIPRDRSCITCTVDGKHAFRIATEQEQKYLDSKVEKFLQSDRFKTMANAFGNLKDEELGMVIKSVPRVKEMLVREIREAEEGAKGYDHECG